MSQIEGPVMKMGHSVAAVAGMEGVRGGETESESPPLMQLEPTDSGTIF